MQQLKSALIVEYGYLRLLLFAKRNGAYTYFNEEKVEYDGFNENGFFGPDDVFSKIQRLYADAEYYGSIDKNALVVLPGIFFKYGIEERDADIASGTVNKNDVKALLSACGQGVQNYEAVQRRSLGYKTLSNPAVKNPIGEKTDLLRATVSVEYLKLNIKELFDNCEKRLDKNFDCTSFGAMVAEKAESDSHCGERIIILLADGNIDVVLCKNGIPVDVQSDLIGARHIWYGLADELKCSDDKAADIMYGANLNLNFSEGDNYLFGTEKYPVLSVNSCLAEAFIYIAGGVKKCVDGFVTDGKPELCFTGSDLCNVRGVKDIFEDETNSEVSVLSSAALNLEGCGNYVAAAIEGHLQHCAAKNEIKSKFKALFGKNR